MIYVHEDDQLRATHLIVGYKITYPYLQKGQDLIQDRDKQLPIIEVHLKNFVPTPM